MEHLDGHTVIDLRERAAVRVAVLGCGYWGTKHLRVLGDLPGVDVVAVDANPARREALEGSRGSRRVHATLDETLAAGIDAVVVATPPASHARLALAALEAGCHVMVEKPLATSMADAVELLAVAETANRTLMVGHTFEYNAAVQYLRTLIRSGRLGDIYYLDSARLNLGLYQHDANVLWDLAVHDVSIANFVLDAVPVTVSAWGHRHAHPQLEDVAYLTMRYENPDVTAHVHVSWLDPAKVRRATVVGSERMAVYDDLNADERVRIYDKGVSMTEPSEHLAVPPFTYRFGDILVPHIDFPEPLVVEDSHFVDCVRSGTPPATDGYNGAAVVAVLEAAERSMRSHREELVDTSLLATVRRRTDDDIWAVR